MVESISTKGALDEFEQQNVEEAVQWIAGKKFKVKDVFTEKFICSLHKRMYADVCAWAGKFRKTDKNLGIDKHHIPIQPKVLCGDALFWAEHGTYPSAEIAVRFKHRIVGIHCFPNGNCRHSRPMADVIIEKLFGEEVFSWGAGSASRIADIRSAYLKAIKAAHKGDLNLLMKFARTSPM